LNLIDNQVRSLRKRELIDAYESNARVGTYWGIRSSIASYALANAIPFPPEDSERLGSVPTRLKALSPATQRGLINWGYSICDTALRTHFDKRFPPPARLPLR
jgi:NTE family protein